jgi:hypothetical protein
LHLKRTQGPTIEKDLNVVFDALSIFQSLYDTSNGNRQKIVHLGVVTCVYIVAGFIVCEACESAKPVNERRPGAIFIN